MNVFLRKPVNIFLRQICAERYFVYSMTSGTVTEVNEAVTHRLPRCRYMNQASERSVSLRSGYILHQTLKNDMPLSTRSGQI